jgi:hypothetical protein
MAYFCYFYALSFFSSYAFFFYLNYATALGSRGIKVKTTTEKITPITTPIIFFQR